MIRAQQENFESLQASSTEVGLVLLFATFAHNTYPALRDCDLVLDGRQVDKQVVNLSYLEAFSSR
jgi:hypothetical protein